MRQTAPAPVLVVAASALHRLPLVSAVRRCGYQPLEAASADEVRTQGTGAALDGALVLLPRGDAADLTLLRTLVTDSGLARVSVVTPYPTDAVVRSVLHAGAWEVVAQPALERRLAQAIHRLAAPPTRRVSERVGAMLPALLTLPLHHADEAIPCIVEDLNLSGVRCWVRDPAAAAHLHPGTTATLTLALPGGARIQAASRVVRQVSTDVIGLTFLHLSELDQQRLERYYAQARQAELRRRAA
jgi:CheY-like chemotaxis protein